MSIQNILRDFFLAVRIPQRVFARIPLNKSLKLLLALAPEPVLQERTSGSSPKKQNTFPEANVPPRASRDVLSGVFPRNFCGVSSNIPPGFVHPLWQVKKFPILVCRIFFFQI